MQIETLKAEIKQISAISAGVPAEFRQKCFELLLTHLLGRQHMPPGMTSAQWSPTAVAPMSSLPLAALGYTGPPPITALLTAFLNKHGLNLDQFTRVVGYIGGKVVLLRQPVGSKTGPLQIEWALLHALKNAVAKGGFSVDAEEVRLTCQEKNCFDRRNFYTNFRRYAEYFRSPPEPAGRAQPLSSKGLAALGGLVNKLTETAD